MTFRPTSCPACGVVLGSIGAPTTTDEIKAAIDALPANDRAMLRPWILAVYNVRGDRARGYELPKE